MTASWADDASREATEAAKGRNEKIAQMFEGGEFPINPIEYYNTPAKIFESLRPVDEECSCQSDNHTEKCHSTNLSANSGFCTACIFGCLP